MEKELHQELVVAASADPRINTTSKLLLLPRELRDMIYAYVVPSIRIRLTHHPNGHLRRTFGSCLLHLCAQIRAESLVLYARAPVTLPWHKIGAYIQTYYPSEHPSTTLNYQGDIELDMMCNANSPTDILPLLRLRLGCPHIKLDFYDIRYAFYGMITSVLNLAFSCVRNSPFKPLNMDITNVPPYTSVRADKQIDNGRCAFWFNHTISNVFLTLERPFPAVRIHFKKSGSPPTLSSTVLCEELGAWIDYVGIKKVDWYGRLSIVIEGDDNVDQLETTMVGSLSG